MASASAGAFKLEDLSSVLDRNSLFSVALPVFGLGLLLGLAVFFLFSKGSKKFPPILPGIPLIGGIIGFTGLKKENGKLVSHGPLGMIERGYKTLGGVFTVPVLHKKITFLIGNDVTVHFFKAQEKELSQKEVYQYSVPTFGRGVVFDVDYSVRMEQFRFFADALRINNMRSYVQMMVQEAERYFSSWGQEGEVDLKEELAKLIIMTASRCLLGREVREQMFGQVSDLFHVLDKGMLPISVILPYLPIKAHRDRDAARKQLAEIFAKIIRERKASGKKETDMLQTFIDAKYRSTGKGTTEEECTGLLTAALFAGQHTSSLTSCWTGAYLYSHKEWQARAEAEQLAVMGRHGGELNYDILNEMDILHVSIKEVLRLHPPLILLFRHVNEAFGVSTSDGRKYTVPAGHIVGTSPQLAGRLAKVYSEPDKFDPGRFLPGREEDKAAGPFSYVAFGGGRHGCMGETFAYMQIKTVWSVLLRQFQLEMLGPIPEDDYDSSIVVGPKGKVMFRYKRRALTPNTGAAA